MKNQDYWKQFYTENEKLPPSSFAIFCLPFLTGKTIELGCGNGRDLYYFIDNEVDAKGVDSAYENGYITKCDVEEYISKNESPNFVYTRFFWHAIDSGLQEKILKWTKKYLFIEARTTKDQELNKTFGDHDRNYVDVSKLVSNLIENGFEIESLVTGYGLSPFKEENPHIIRLIAKKAS